MCHCQVLQKHDQNQVYSTKSSPLYLALVSWTAQVLKPVDAQSSTWDEGPLFDTPPSLAGRAGAEPCPEGAAEDAEGTCTCSFGYEGNPRWDTEEGQYVGNCTLTPCPPHSSPGDYEGTCSCNPTYKGKLVWTATPSARYSGYCRRVPCPGNSTLIPRENRSHTNDSNVSHDDDDKADNVGCRCTDTEVGGFVWHSSDQRFVGECLPRQPCHPGFRGATVTLQREIATSGSQNRAAESIPPSVLVRGTCERAECPAHAALNLSSGLCDCIKEQTGQYVGELKWNVSAEAYDGHCEPAIRCGTLQQQLLVKLSTAREHVECVCVGENIIGDTVLWGINGSKHWSGHCRPAPCPEGASRRSPDSGDTSCVCKDGFKGSLVWSSELLAYSGQCEEIVTTTTYIISYTTTTITTTTTTTTSHNATREKEENEKEKEKGEKEKGKEKENEETHSKKHRAKISLSVYLGGLAALYVSLIIGYVASQYLFAEAPARQPEIKAEKTSRKKSGGSSDDERSSLLS